MTSKAEGLETSLNSLEVKRAGEAKQLAVAQKDVELLRNQLRSVSRGAREEPSRRHGGGD